MELQKLMAAAILIVEDETPEDFKDFITEVSPARLESVGISKFVVDTASTLEKAMNLLSRRIRSPYNIVLLDMLLPGHSTGEVETGGFLTQEPDLKYRGFKILSFINETKAAEDVIIISAYPENMLEIFRRGASDFVEKPFEPEELQDRVLVCWSRLLLKKSRRVFDERISGLVPYAEKGLAYRFAICFSDLTRAVADGREDIERYMQERYGLDRQKDAHDFLFKSLAWQEESVAKAKGEWEALRSSLISPDETPRKKTVESILRSIHESLLPCFIVKRVELEVGGESTSSVLTFEDDVHAVLKEILVGAMTQLQDHGDERQTIEVNVEPEDGQVKVSFSDRLEPISPDDAMKINEGLSIAPRQRFGRVWGLAVVQHVARRGGGHLEVTPHAGGNVVTYFIPSAN